MDPLYQVTFRHRGQLIRLQVPRTAEQVEALRRDYDDVVAMPVKPANEFSTAIDAIMALYRAAKAKGDNVMMRRAETAAGALVGLSNDKPAEEAPISPPRRRFTLLGLGR